MRFNYNTYYLLLIRRILLLFLVFSASRLFFLLYNLSYFPDLDFLGTLRIFWGGLRFDTTAILYANITFIILYLLPFTFTFKKGYQKFLKIWYVTTNFLMVIINMFDTIYFRFTLKRIDFSFFKEFSFGDANGLKIFTESLKLYWVVFLFGLFLLFILIFLYGKAQKNNIKRADIKFVVARVFAIIIAIGLSIIGVRGGTDRTTRPITLSNAGEYVKRPIEACIVLNAPFSIMLTTEMKWFDEVHYYKNEEELANVYTPIKVEKSPREFKPYNVVIIILESFGSEHINKINKDMKTSVTPFLDSLIENSHACLNAYTNGGKSIDALPCIMGSIPSLVNPYAVTPYALNSIKSLPAILREKSYSTSFFHGAPNGSMGISSMTNMFGIEKYYGMNEFGNNSLFDGSWGIWDEPFLLFFADKLSTFKQPFLSSVFTVSSHHPFKVPQEYENKLPNGEIPLQKCIAYTDQALRKFFKKVENTEWFKNTLFVLSADHASHSSLYPKYNTSVGGMAIPILYYFPGKIEKQKDYRLTSQIDIMPTILEFLNYDKSYFAYGRDINDSLTKPFVVNYSNAYQLMMDNYLLTRDYDKNTGFYEFTKDSLLKNNLLNKNIPGLIEKEKFFKAFIQQYNNRLIKDRMLPSSK